MTPEQEIKMFGETIESMRKMNPYTDLPHLPILNITYAMGILSDAQEVMERGNVEQARQFINKAKYFLSEVSTSLHPANQQEKT